MVFHLSVYAFELWVHMGNEKRVVNKEKTTHETIKHWVIFFPWKCAHLQPGQWNSANNMHYVL